MTTIQVSGTLAVNQFRFIYEDKIMARKDFESVMIKRDLTALAMTGNSERKQRKSAYLTRVLADGLKYRFSQHNFRPPTILLDTLTARELFVFFARWNDATETVCSKMGPLGNRYEFATVSPFLEYAEPDKQTYVPVEINSCGPEKVRTDHGNFPIYIAAYGDINLSPISKKELDGLQTWLELSPEI